MATRIYHDADADLGVLKSETIAVIGYGNQGRSQALNLRDSGLSVIVGNVADATRQRAREDGFEACSIADACRRAGVVMLLVPDEAAPQVYREEIEPNLAPGSCLDFATGYNVAFGAIEPRADLDVVMVAPRMIGVGVRESYEQGNGFPSFICVHQDATGKAQERMLALAKGVGSTRAGCIELSMRDEATLDLFNEQGFGPAFGRVLMTAVDTLVQAGFPPEAVLLELYLSGEFAYTLKQIREVGLVRQMDFHSRTSQYGSITRSGRFNDLGKEVGARMDEILEEIRSGSFAREWTDVQSTIEQTLANIREFRSKLPIVEWEDRARTSFGIGQRGSQS